ncbi:MAG: class I SAM-dependent methyltransferase [Chloroflexota bacterium]
MHADMDDPTRRFSSRVDDYVRYRPSYPGAVVDVIRQHCGLTGAWVVADIGSGPGHLTRLFLANGNPVIGVEPNREMREAGEHLLRDAPRFTSVDGTAEDTTLDDDSVDLIVAGQAFHWFDHRAARREFDRILTAHRWVALVWNERRTTSTPFLAAYEELLLRHAPEYARVGHRLVVGDDVLAEFFGPNGYGRATVPNQQVFDFQGVRGRLLSSSYAPRPGHEGYEAMIADLRRLVDAYQVNGTVTLEYDTTIYHGRL